MRRKNNIFFIFIICTFFIFVFIFTNPILNKTVIPATFQLMEHPGFDHEPGELRFGGIVQNSSGSRNLEIKNTFNKPILISIKSNGEISKRLIVSENNFYLKPNETKNISFTIYSSGLTKYKKYFGKIIIISKKA